ncbi:endo alpha-1,4 polygalactosaminidase [Nakamurella alba]|uniref:endo alpha-1,4 polygalactosaminidase n=1 Tax=Nakamurella alba TaxID=2665158 RepID=UPI002AC3395A|nr:endo alpha-1,4 polygalactosaminidase [Nakamurella alba]
MTAAPVQLWPAGVGADYQLGGGYPPAAGVGVVARDSSDEPAAGVWNICYVNGFQSQPQDREKWLAERQDLVLLESDGTPVIDEGWPDELLLDTTTEAKRERLVAVLDPTLTGCAADGFDAIELDNLDSWTRSGGRLTEDGNIAFAALLVQRIHQLGLAAGQKNTPQLGARGPDEIGYDFVVAEECLVYDECAAYTDVYGDAVLDIEYSDTEVGATAADWAAACADPARPATIVLRDRLLAVAGSDGYVRDGC